MSWTVETLLEHINKILDDRDRRYEQRFEAQQRAIDKADTATEKRFEGVNEFRQSLADQNKMFLQRTEYESNHLRLMEAHEELARRVEAFEGRSSGLRQGWIYILGGATLLSVGVSLYMVFRHV